MCNELENAPWVSFNVILRCFFHMQLYIYKKICLTIGNQKKAIELWRQSSPRVKSLFNYTRDAIFIIKDAVIVDCNDAAPKVFGGEMDDIVGESLFKFFPEKQASGENSLELATDLMNAVLEGHPQFMEWDHKKLDGTTFISDVMVNKIAIGSEEYVQAIIRDRSLEIKTETENKKLATLANVTTNMVIMADAEGKIEWINQAFTRVTGYTLEEAMGKKPGDFLQGTDSDPETIRYMSEMLKRGQGFRNVEIINYTKTGIPYWVSIELNPIKDADGNVVQFIAIESDITERKFAEKALSESEKRFRALIRQSPIGVIEWGLNFQVREWNAAAEKIFGYNRMEAIGKNAAFLLTEEVKPMVTEVWKSLISLKGGERSTNENITKSGKIITCEWYNSPLVNDQGQILGVVSMVEDITEKLIAEKNLKENEIKFRQIFQSSPMGIFMYEIKEDNELYLIETNEAADDLLGVECRKRIGMKITDAFPALEDTDLPKHFHKAASLGVPYHTRDTHYDDGEISGVYEVNVFQAGLNRMVVMFLDVTDQIKAEESIRNKNDELLKINAELDRFVYSASHDLRAPIASLLGSIEVMRKETELENISQLLGMQERSLQRLDNFIGDIVNYSRNTRLQIEKDLIDLEKEIQDTFEQFQFMDNFEKIKREFEIDQEVDFISDNRRLKIILNNLISNSIKYADHSKGDPFIQIKAKVGKKNARILIKDNGIGIEKVQLESIFQMFFRASEKSTGSGLGLYIVKEVIQRLKGEIKVDSTPRKGSEFIISIPNLY